MSIFESSGAPRVSDHADHHPESRDVSLADESMSSGEHDPDEDDLSRQNTPGPDDSHNSSSGRGSNRIKGPWSKEEDDLLASLVSQLGAKKWSMIAEQIPGRIGKQCRERWMNHLDTSVKKSPWTEEEDAILIETQRKLGNRWCEIARALPGRPENAVKNRYNSLTNKGRSSDPRPRSPVSSVSDSRLLLQNGSPPASTIAPSSVHRLSPKPDTPNRRTVLSEERKRQRLSGQPEGEVIPARRENVFSTEAHKVPSVNMAYNKPVERVNNILVARLSVNLLPPEAIEMKESDAPLLPLRKQNILFDGPAFRLPVGPQLTLVPQITTSTTFRRNRS